MRLAPFMSFYGSKWRAANRYPAPAHETIVEPFAGGAGYALRHFQKRVILIDRDPRIAKIWRFLLRARPRDVLALPLLALDQSVTDLPQCDPGGFELIRSWLQGGARNGKNRFSSMARAAFADNPRTPSFWGAACRARIATQVEAIAHWQFIEGDYSLAPDVDATWFVDPPYDNAAGRVYTHHDIDYPSLGAWCKGLRGQVIACENDGASWLPFRSLYRTSNGWNGPTKRSSEAIWTTDEVAS